MFTLAVALLPLFGFAQWIPGGTGYWTAWPIGIKTVPTGTYFLESLGDIRFWNGPGDYIEAARPNAENGFSLIQGTGQRADLRFDGNTLKLVTNTGGTVPIPENGITINTNGFVGMGNANAPYRLTINDKSNNDFGAWICSKSTGPSLFVRKDDYGTATNSYTALPNFAFQAENYVTSATAPFNGGALITGFDWGTQTYAKGQSTSAQPKALVAIAESDPANHYIMDISTGIIAQGLDAHWAYGITSIGVATNEDGKSIFGTGIQSTGQVKNGESNFWAISTGVDARALGGNEAIGVSGLADWIIPSNKLHTAYGVKGVAQDASYLAYGVFGFGTADQSSYGVFGRGLGTSSETGTQSYGLYGIGTVADKAYGAYAYGSETTISYGVWGEAEATSGTTYGLYGWGHGGSTNWSGYFNGAAFCSSGYWTPSDQQFKENITPLNNSLDIINNLNPKKYTFKQSDEFLGMTFPTGDSYGLIAQELELVLPTLVKQSLNPEIKDTTGKLISKKFEFKAVEYVSLIPILVGGIKEQQIQINAKDSLINILASQIKNIHDVLTKNGLNVNLNNSSYYNIVLYQNNPNPFKDNASINYTIPVDAGISSSTLYIYDLSGKQIKKYEIQPNSGNGSVQIQSGELQPGIYIYSLICDNKIIDTKKMIIKD